MDRQEEDIPEDRRYDKAVTADSQNPLRVLGALTFTTKILNLDGRLTAACVYPRMAKYASEGDQDRRTAVRIQTQRSGKILCGAFAWDCVIRDLSSGGARIQMLSGAAPPGKAQLIDLVAGLAHDVTVAWQRDREVGMRIVRTYDLRGLTPAIAGAAKRIWLASQSGVSTG